MKIRHGEIHHYSETHAPKQTWNIIGQMVIGETPNTVFSLVSLACSCSHGYCGYLLNIPTCLCIFPQRPRSVMPNLVEGNQHFHKMQLSAVLPCFHNPTFIWKPFVFARVPILAPQLPHASLTECCFVNEQGPIRCCPGPIFPTAFHCPLLCLWLLLLQQCWLLQLLPESGQLLVHLDAHARKKSTTRPAIFIL